MRLSARDQKAIISTFKKCFKHNDHLWLFGSRVDPNRRGGDIDLYIETSEIDGTKIFQNKISFLTKVQLEIGEQKIDVVIKSLHDKDQPIYVEARETGIQLV